MEKASIFYFFKEIREKDYGEKDFNDKLREFSNNFEISTLDYINLDLQKYIAKEVSKDLKKNKKVKIKALIGQKGKPQPFQIDYSSLNSPIEFERLIFLQNFLIDKIFDIKSKKKIDEKLVDLSNSKGTEKIIMLKLLGVLEFLEKKEPFNMSKNMLASALSGITGIKSSTIQSYINPMYSPKAIQKNNPLTTESTVEKVKQKLSKIGFIPPK